MISTTLGQNLIVNAPDTIAINFGDLFEPIDGEKFIKLCERNPDLRIERTREGDIIAMPPVYTETSAKNFEIVVELGIWARRDGSGRGFESSAGFILPNGAIRSPDAAWISFERWNALPAENRQKFARVAPDFVIELRSAIDNLTDLQEKMREYVENGVSLGWLIDPKNKRVYIYRPKTEAEVLENSNEVSGAPLLNGFVLSLQRIWD